MDQSINPSFARKLSGGGPGSKRVLFLGYDRDHTRLIDLLISKGAEVWHAADKITAISGFDLVVSFGYIHLLKKPVIDGANAPILNLHIAYLPYNRGAHPNFWSFYEDTPSGVTIHLIDPGVDTGPILFRKYVNFAKDEDTFKKTHRRLVEEIQNLFADNIDDILALNLHPRPQRIKGTHHRESDLPKSVTSWDEKIEDVIRRLDDESRQTDGTPLSVPKTRGE